jgi:hypothetical protein
MKELSGMKLKKERMGGIHLQRARVMLRDRDNGRMDSARFAMVKT